MKVSQRYKKIYGDYWRTVDEHIISLICKHISKSEKILEVGFASGHFLAALHDLGYDADGIELRKESFETTKNNFKEEYEKVRIFNGDVMSFSSHCYSIVFCTGLIQCFELMERSRFLSHIATLSKKAVYTVPLIKNERNVGSDEKAGVEGCTEYNTQDIAYLLSNYYGYVETGIWRKNEIEVEDDFMWFYCNNSRCFA